MAAPSSTLSFASEHDSLSIRSFTVNDRMSALFDVSITALSRQDDIDFETIIGQPASFRIAPSDGALTEARSWAGICMHFEQIQAEDAGLSTYLVRIVPELWLLTQRQNNRIFQHMTVPDIVKQLLEEWKVPYTFTVDQASYAKLEYRVQYAESDFAFLSRMLEEAGISYFFATDQNNQSRVMLTDKPQSADKRPGGPVPFVESPGQNAARDFVTKVRTAREIRPGALTLRDFDFRGRLTYPLFGKAGYDGGRPPCPPAQPVPCKASRPSSSSTGTRPAPSSRRASRGPRRWRTRTRRRGRRSPSAGSTAPARRGRASPSRPTRSTSGPAAS